MILTNAIHYFVKQVFFLLVLFLSFSALSQTTINDVYNPDPELLNKFILQEVNKIRKKEKVEPLENKTELLLAAQDHAEYMLEKEKITHFQRFNKKKKYPKNRVDFYGRQFNVVGENVQLTNLKIGNRPDDKKNPPITTYEKLAEELVTNWKNSPPHFQNMVSPDFKTTYVAVAVNADGEVYACQLFGGSIYQTKYEEQVDTLKYKPENPRRCRWCQGRVPLGTVVVLPDSSIVFTYSTFLRRPTYKGSRMRLFNPWNDGIAANIVLKSQYPCDSSNYFNGRRAVRGIPLPPVYKKDYFVGMFNTRVYLGKVPSYINEDFEVNLTVVKNKRTCSEIIYNIIPSWYYVDIPLTFGIEPQELLEEDLVLDTISAVMFFRKGQIEPIDSSALNDLSEFLSLNKGKIDRISLEGYASIEGTKEGNTVLYSNRAKYLSDFLVGKGIDVSRISTTVNENFEDFREDIVGTEFEYLGKLSDSELKNALKDNALEQKLEPILAKHRYVHVIMTTKDTVDLVVTKEMVQTMFRQAVESKKARYAAQLQRVQYHFILQGEMDLEELDDVEIPMMKRNKLLLHNKAAIRFLVDTLNKDRYSLLEDDLEQVKLVDTTFKRVRTSLAILEYYKWEQGRLDMSRKKYFKKLKTLKYVDKRIQARIILNFASRCDWTQLRKKKRYHNRVKSYIGNARLDADKTFELASYYSYFKQNKFAYDLVKNKIDETDNPEDLVYFLKLIHLTNVNLPHDKYIGYFKKLLKYRGAEFCTYFNSPNLNFQILDDPDVKEIYCKECAGVLNTETRKSATEE